MVQPWLTQIPTNFMKTLELKVGARIQLIYNIDTGDCLTNGTRGTVQAFITNRAGKTETIMIKFDEKHQGEETRNKNIELKEKYPGLTPIRKFTLTYSSTRNQSSNKRAKLIQFPLR